MVYFHDASLVRLIHKVETDKSVRTVCLANKDESDMKIPNKLGYIIWWGLKTGLKIQEKEAYADRCSTSLKFKGTN